MQNGPVVIPPGSLSHLPNAEVAADQELAALARLVAAGYAWHGIALPASFEERFYRLNNLPHQLLSLYQGLDPGDPDEDIVEEAEAAAVALVAQHYLLDESVDLIYDSLTWNGAAVVRRASAGEGKAVSGRRGVLLAVKQLYRDDWTVDAVMDRLAASAALGLEARPVLVTTAPERLDPLLSSRASSTLGVAVKAWVDDAGGLTRVTFT